MRLGPAARGRVMHFMGHVMTTTTVLKSATTKAFPVVNAVDSFAAAFALQIVDAYSIST